MNPTSKLDAVCNCNRHSRTREWLAEQCGVELQTVYHWLSRGIPSKGQIIIEKLIRADAEKNIETGQEPPPAYVTIQTTLNEYRDWEQCAYEARQTLSNWALEVIREEYRQETAAKSKGKRQAQM